MTGAATLADSTVMDADAARDAAATVRFQLPELHISATDDADIAELSAAIERDVSASVEEPQVTLCKM